MAHAQVVAKKDLELIRDQRLLENNIDKMKLTGEALNRIRTNMGMIDLSLRWVSELTYDSDRLLEETGGFQLDQLDQLAVRV